MSKKSSKPRIKAVLFDLGKVLLYFQFDPAFRRLARHCDSSPKDIEAFFIQSGLEVLYDGGQISSRNFYAQIRNALGLRLSFERFRDIWNHIFTPIGPMIRLVGRLRPKYRLVLISNTNAMHFEYAKRRYPVLKQFHRHIVSYKEKVRKPDERIYRTAVRACQAKPSEILYIDDRADLTQAASELGLNTFTFKSDPAKLVKTMKKMGIL